MIEGEGDAFWFYQTQVFNSESHEGDLINKKSGIASSLKPASPN
jgi:hypothetical protein